MKFQFKKSWVAVVVIAGLCMAALLVVPPVKGTVAYITGLSSQSVNNFWDGSGSGPTEPTDPTEPTTPTEPTDPTETTPAR